MNALWNIEAFDDRGESMGIADIVTFTHSRQEGVVHFEAVWPERQDWEMHRVTRLVIEGKPMGLEKPVVVARGDTLRVRGLCNGQWAGRKGQLDG